MSTAVPDKVLVEEASQQGGPVMEKLAEPSQHKIDVTTTKADNRHLVSVPKKIVVPTIHNNQLNITQAKASPTPGQPLMEFTLFEKLVPDIRIKIWGFYIMQPRIIELECECRERHNYCPGWWSLRKSHRVTQQSRHLPPALLVNKEARHEALKFYKLVMFDAPLRNGNQQPIFYNKACDILYFGKSTSMYAVVAFCQFAHVTGLCIPRIALQSDLYHCFCGGVFRCSWEHEAGFGSFETHPLRGHDQAHDTIRVLHGVPSTLLSADMPNASPGVPGVKEIYFVNSSDLWNGRFSGSQQLEFRKAIGDGTTPCEIENQRKLVAQVDKIQESGEIEMVGDNKWTGDQLPTFHYVHPAPQTVGNTDRIYDSLVFEPRCINKLSINKWEFVKTLRGSTGVDIIFASEGRSKTVQEIGFFGARDQVEIAKAAIRERVARRF